MDGEMPAMEAWPMDPPPEQGKKIAFKESHIDASEEAAVKEWNRKIGAAKARFKPDFKRMKLNCAFLAGYQWPGQKTLEWTKVVINVCLQMVKDICSNLYAKNPKISVDRRKTMDFEIWDESNDSLKAAQMVASSPLTAMNEQELSQQLQAQAQAKQLLQDVEIGQQWQKQVDRVAKTLLVVDDWMIANCQPSYKASLKQLVMDVLICGVAYEATDLTRSYEGAMAQGEIENTMLDRTKEAGFLASQIAEGVLQKDSPEVQKLMMIVQSLQYSQQQGDGNNINERISWAYPLPWSIIPDPDCTNLVNFVGADWICEEQIKPLDEVNGYFELRGDDMVKTGASDTTAKEYSPDGGESDGAPGVDDPKKVKRVLLRHVWQLSTKSDFYIVDGWKKWVRKPEPVTPETNYFWPARPLVFNFIRPVREGEHPVSIFPPSHVDVLRDPQKEINRCGQSLRKHRQANLAKWVYNSGLIDSKDVARIANADDQEFVPVKSLQPGQRLEDALHAFDGSKFHAELVDTGPQIRDMQMVSTSSSAVSSPAGNHKQTATAAHIQEQSRTSILSSDVDTLDEFLTVGAEQRGEMMLRELTKPTVMRIAGRGSVWPESPQMRQQFVQALTLTIKAASSGRPNQALRVATAERIGPLLVQAMTQQNLSLEPVVEEYAHALDETLDVAKFFKQAPIPPPQPPPGGPKGPPGKPQQPPQPGAQAKPPQKQMLTNGAPALGLQK
jgi:hypothetical protein